jgi:carboxypeptidase C (cathepsin A)
MPSPQKSTPLVNADARSARLISLAKRRALVALLLAIVGVLGFALVDVSIPLDLAADDPSYLCDPASRQDAGYVKLANKVDDHYFYWYFESRRSPATDPLVLWLTGGPGGSSIMAMLAENGPCNILPGVATETNPYSWPAQANVLWLDQPTSVGFSYGEKQDKDFNETDVGENIFWFLQGFLAKHLELEGRKFFITGESYGGHYVPVAAHYLWRQSRLIPGVVKLNLQGIAIGNGLTDPIIQVRSP